jgi:hypothetical protein
VPRARRGDPAALTRRDRAAVRRRHASGEGARDRAEQRLVRDDPGIGRLRPRRQHDDREAFARVQIDHLADDCLRRERAVVGRVARRQ